jgi:hypothetical protein
MELFSVDSKNSKNMRQLTTEKKSNGMNEITHKYDKQSVHITK